MPPPSASPREDAATLTAWLRSRSDDELAELLRRRPDLALPAPADLAMLASRLGVRTSVQRAVDALDAFTLRVLETVALAAGSGAQAPASRSLSQPAPAVAPAGADRRAVVDLLSGDGEDPPASGELVPDRIEAALAELGTLGLVWGDGPVIRLVASVGDALGTYPAGLGRPAAALLASVSDVQLAPVLRALGLAPAGQPRAGEAVAAVLGDRARVRELVAQGDDEDRQILDRLAAGPPVGSVRTTRLPPPNSDPDQVTAPQRLMVRGLLVPVDAQTVELPREVGLVLRGSLLAGVGALPPRIATVEHEPAELDRMGTTAVLETLRLVEAIAEAWTAHPPPMLRAGGVGVRDLRRTARELGVDEATVAAVAETAYAAGLLGPTNGVDPVYLPTTDYDSWAGHPAAQRWADLAAAWMGMSRQPGLVGQRGERDRVVTLLGPDAERGTTPGQRARVLQVLTDLPPGSSPVRPADVLAHLAWIQPRRAAGLRPLAEAVLREADLLGVSAAGGLTGYSRTLIDGSRTAAVHVLANALPEPVEQFLVQPDLTVVVPGPPSPALAAELTVLADLESTGGANVYRITEATVRRALDAGRSGSDLAAFVSRRSTTPVPQALTYLIDDAARRHGVLRIGAAGSYLRCDDEALLARVLADRASAALELRGLAPTVLVSPAPVSRVLEVLRAAGYAPAAEGSDGGVITLAADAPRAPARNATRIVRPRPSVESRAQLDELVRRIRSGDTLTELSQRVQPLVQQVPGVTSATTMALLRQAIREGRRVLLGHAEPDGTASRHTILPISLAGGFVRGHESATSRLQSFPLHRLTAVSIVADDPDEPG